MRRHARPEPESDGGGIQCVLRRLEEDEGATTTTTATTTATTTGKASQLSRTLPTFNFEDEDQQTGQGAETERGKYEQEVRAAVQADIQRTLGKSKAYVKAKQGPPKLTVEALGALAAPRVRRLHPENQACALRGIDDLEYARLRAGKLEESRVRREAAEALAAKEDAEKRKNVDAYRACKASRSETKATRIEAEKAAASAYGKAVATYVREQATADLAVFRERKAREREAAALLHQGIQTQNFNVQ
ncbi:hypothetical protein FOA52_000323 [Chlamydomonas sp. UWO 241]|nr:hypothetical protein FOA52_000323 [Chlamydomonas sp. UWO 241]